MKGNQKRIISLTMVLQIFIISFAVMVIPVSAEDLSLPDMPLTLRGNVELDGVPASVGTSIYAELNGAKASKIISVVNEGEYSFPVTCSSEDYSSLKFYVNEIETKLVDATVFDGANAGDTIESINLVAISPVNSDGNNDGSDGSNGGSSRYISTETMSDSDEDDSSASTASTSTTDIDDTSLKSVAETSQPMESTEDVPAPETKTSITVLVIGAIVLLGIVVTVVYKLKEN
jgi:hypothetical protein